MAIVMKLADDINAGVRATLAAGDDLFIAAGVTVSRTDATLAAHRVIAGVESNHDLEILGTVISQGGVVQLGDDIADSNNRVHVGETGYLNSLHSGGSTFSITGTSNYFENDGEVRSNNIAISMNTSASTSGFNEIVNSGTLHGKLTAISIVGGEETVSVTNTGKIVAGTAYLGGAGSDFIGNFGTISGHLLLGAGTDGYDGSKGRHDGLVDAGTGDDLLIGGVDDDTFNGGEGADTMRAGGGSDSYSVDNAGDIVFEATNQGIDQVAATISYTLTANIEDLALFGSGKNGTGNTLANSIAGNNLANMLAGLAGNDTLGGGDGNDKLIGGLGKDTLTGDNQADRFIFNAVTESRAAGGIDKIMDFSRAQLDKIQLNLIDADTTKAGNQAFKFIGAKAFSGAAGELRFQKIGTDSHIQADVNGDGKIDFTVISDVAVTFVKGDFIL
ncbi:MAG TPA: calcium-binding protein [Rhizobiaceae bacterium]|nr:calcium-binding protein [Rhizobiaceae bacterium]